MRHLEHTFSAMLFTALFVLSSAVSAQQQYPKIDIPYSYGFEDSETEENALWVLNGKSVQIPDGHDQWHRDASVFSEGRKSMYISCDGGVSPNYCFEKNVTVAYRPITFPPGEYVLTFDWQNNAVINSSKNGMYVCFIQDVALGLPDTGPESVVNQDRLPLWAMSYIQPIKTSYKGKTDHVAGALEWENASVDLKFSKETSGYLTFIWKNSKTDSVYNPIAACVDNIQITSADCTPPSDLTLEAKCDTVIAKWKGTSEKYTLEYKQNGTDRWIPVSNIYNRTEYTVAGIDEGIYDFRVRGVCNDTVLSAWNTKTGVLVFCAENHCINYTVLSNEVNPSVQCYVGTAGKNNWTPCEPIDYGPTTHESRHAVCWTRNATDPMTNNGLRTIPEGEFVSIRLGNPLVSSQAERVDFDYYVDDPNKILLLKYAIVFEDPSGHNMKDKPFFSLSILDEDGFPMTGDEFDCGNAEFYADANRKEDGWHTARVSGKEPISWKEWTTVGINLSKYTGMNIKISLETHDCTLGAHFGYAYFTLGCADGTIESISCGADEFMEVKAPDGFDYQWFTEYDENNNPADNKGTEQKITVAASDKTVYRCRCMFKEDHGCFFDLYTVVSPREAFAEFEWTHVPENCENIVRLVNKSHVTSIDDTTGEVIHTTEDTQTSYWYIDGSTDPITRRNFDITANPQGDTINIHLITGISNDQCQDDTTITIIVPSIITPSRTLDTVLCFNDHVVWGGKYIMESGIFPDSLVNYAGCDSIVWLNVTVRPEIEDTYDTAWVCYGDTLIYSNGKKYYETDERKTIFFTTATGCDSIVYLNFTVRDQVTFNVEATAVGDAPNTGEITITEAPEKYTWSVNGVMNMSLTGLAGGKYDVVVYDSAGCAGDVQTVYIDQSCLEVNVDFNNLNGCADDSIITVPCEVTDGYPSKYRIEYGDAATKAGFVDFTDTLDRITFVLPDNVRPGRYDATVIIEDKICGDTVINVSFDVLYPSDIVKQKWNDVLAVTNENYNGGYRFSAYQWYKDNAPITGEQGAYMYLGTDDRLDTGSMYWVELTREDDGVTMPSCPIVPDLRTDISEYPVITTAYSGQRVKINNISGKTTVKIFTVSGILYSTAYIDEYTVDVTMPDETGVYVMVIERDGNKVHHKITVNAGR